MVYLMHTVEIPKRGQGVEKTEKMCKNCWKYELRNSTAIIHSNMKPPDNDDDDDDIDQRADEWVRA